MPNIFPGKDDCCFVYPFDVVVIAVTLWASMRTAAFTRRLRALAPFAQAVNITSTAILSCMAVCGQCRALSRVTGGVLTFLMAVANTAAVCQYVVPPLEMICYQLVHLLNLGLIYLFAVRWETPCFSYLLLALLQGTSLCIVGLLIVNSVFLGLTRLQEITAIQLMDEFPNG